MNDLADSIKRLRDDANDPTEAIQTINQLVELVAEMRDIIKNQDQELFDLIKTELLHYMRGKTIDNATAADKRHVGKISRQLTKKILQFYASAATAKQAHEIEPSDSFDRNPLMQGDACMQSTCAKADALLTKLGEV